jgi:hypothetical protein
MRKLQNGQAASRKKQSSVRLPLAPLIETGLPSTSLSDKGGAAANDFNRILVPLLVAACRGSCGDGAGAVIAGRKYPLKGVMPWLYV